MRRQHATQVMIADNAVSMGWTQYSIVDDFRLRSAVNVQLPSNLIRGQYATQVMNAQVAVSIGW